MDETAERRRRRRQQRVLFDQVADLYERTRHGYADEVVDLLVDTAGVGPGDPVLEVGCGTGQLTESLARRGVAVRAVDISPQMAARARRRLEGLEVTVEVSAFEDVAVAPGSLAAVVSATAFHWVDPDVAWTKSASLLRPGGWVAILATSERYDDPFGVQLREQWLRYSSDGGAWATSPAPTLSETIAASGLFEPASTHLHTQPRCVSRDVIIGLEQTRATFLSYDDDKRAEFVRDLRVLLQEMPEVPLHQETSLTMARRRT